MTMHLPDKIEHLPIETLMPYARNSRTHDDAQVAAVARSIKEFGFTNPVLIRDDGTIVAGHGRVMAAKTLGLERVPVIRLAHLTEAQARAYVIADNRLAEMAGWDDGILALELRELQADGFDLSLTGFEGQDLEDILFEPPPPKVPEDEIPAVPVTPKTRAGDIWVLGGGHRLMCGDSTSLTAVEALMDGKKADMVFTDPPYGVDYEGINNDSREGLNELLTRVFANLAAVCKPGAPAYVFHSDRCADIFHQVFRRHCHFSSMVVWVKPSLVLSQTDYQSRHEPCLYGWFQGAAHPWYADRKQTSIWEFGKESVEGHTTPKPVDLVAQALGNSSLVGQVVVDLFGGSGSTLIGCAKTGRQARVMEIDPKYCDVIVRRWQTYSGQRALHAVTGEPFGD